MLNNSAVEKEFLKVRRFNKKTVVVHASYKLNLLEQNAFNLFQYILTKVYQKSFSSSCRIKYRDFREFLGGRKRNINRSKIRNLLSSLATKQIIFDVIKKKSFYKQSNLRMLNEGTYGVTLIDGWFMPKNEDEDIEIKIPALLMEAIKSKEEVGHIHYSLFVGLQSKCKYTPRLYEFLLNATNISIKVQHKKIVEKKIDIETLRLIIGVEEEKYFKFNDFKTKVIDEAQKECNRFGLVFEYDLLREGKKVKYFLFRINQQNAKKIIDMDMKLIKNQMLLKESQENDIFILHAQKHAEEVNLNKFAHEITSRHQRILNIVGTNKALIYKIILKDGTSTNTSFDQLEEVIQYDRYCSIKNNREEKIDASIFPDEPEIMYFFRDENEFDKKMRQEREAEEKVVLNKDIKDMTSRELLIYSRIQNRKNKSIKKRSYMLNQGKYDHIA